jgi:hypothetical protein
MFFKYVLRNIPNLNNIKLKLNLSLRVITRHEGVLGSEVVAPPFLASAVEACECLALSL